MSSADHSSWTANEAHIAPARQTPFAAVAGKDSLYGPIAKQLMHRALAIWLLFCVIGTVPTLLNATGLAEVSTAWQALGWGLWLPGGGFVAVGGWLQLLFPATMALTVLAYWLWILSGAVSLPLLVWIAAAVGAYFAAQEGVIFPHTWLIVPGVAIALIVTRLVLGRRNRRAAISLGRRLNDALPSMLAKLDAVAVPQPDARVRELTPDELAAARYLLDLALQPVGQFEGYTRLDNFQLAALRYQLNYIGYGLMLLQCKYVPSFHGYLNQAQRHVIESLTRPQVCAYWKLESLWGNFTWNPDPINTRDNIMLSGLSLPQLAGYAANTGDLRYQCNRSLPFKPFRWRNVEYAHDTQSFVEAILWNWSRSSFFLYPCEPRWVFPICNAYALCGMIAYDRVNGTSHAVNAREQYMQKLESEFMTPDGGVHPEISSLIGICPFDGVRQMEFDNLTSLAQVLNAVHRPYAKCWYAIAREESLELGPDGLSLRGQPWDECVDFGNYRRNPGMALATIALAAREHGDDTIARAAHAKADELLVRTSEPGVLAYQDVSTSANTNLAVSRWARHDDWHDLFHVGPPADALRGPILTGCAYPDVLVARAMSDGDSLDLVLYHGRQPGQYSITVERLKPGAAYRVRGASPEHVVAPADGKVALDVRLKGRTELRLEPVA